MMQPELERDFRRELRYLTSEEFEDHELVRRILALLGKNGPILGPEEKKAEGWHLVADVLNLILDIEEALQSQIQAAIERQPDGQKNAFTALPLLVPLASLRRVKAHLTRFEDALWEVSKALSPIKHLAHRKNERKR